MIILAAFTKRAQIPFSAWLPAAMAAPTPVSALVHSSTLVTAGVYLLIRFNHYIQFNNFLLLIGCLTIFMSGAGALFETDFKKIIALSTLSQLGFIMFSLGMGMPEYAFFHLITHAIFKSLLFLCAGVFIHSLGGTQDIRLIGGGLFFSNPFTSILFSVSSMALCGFPFLSGFYSKDLIIELYLFSYINVFIYCLVMVSTMLTLIYSVRLFFYLFFRNMGVKSLVSLSENFGIILRIRIIGLFSVFLGAFIRFMFFPSFIIYLGLLFKLSVLLGLAAVFIVSFKWLAVVNFLIIKINLVNKFLGQI